MTPKTSQDDILEILWEKMAVDEVAMSIRRPAREPYAWDGVAEVRPFGAMEKNIVEGVY